MLDLIDVAPAAILALALWVLNPLIMDAIFGFPCSACKCRLPNWQKTPLVADVTDEPAETERYRDGDVARTWKRFHMRHKIICACGHINWIAPWQSTKLSKWMLDASDAPRAYDCSACDGDDDACEVCEGSGFYTDHEILQFVGDR